MGHRVYDLADYRVGSFTSTEGLGLENQGVQMLETVKQSVVVPRWRWQLKGS